MRRKTTLPWGRSVSRNESVGQVGTDLIVGRDGWGDLRVGVEKKSRVRDRRLILWTVGQRHGPGPREPLVTDFPEGQKSR